MKTKKLTFASLCLSIAVLLPQLFHLLGMQQAGQVFLPMHIPVLLGGLLLGWQYGALVGVTSPFISCLLTGMPSSERVLFMMAELSAYGLVSGFIYHRFQKHTLIHAYIALIFAMTAGRLLYGISLMTAARLFDMPISALTLVGTAIITGIPGILTQLMFLPALVRVIEKGGMMRDAFAVESHSE